MSAFVSRRGHRATEFLGIFSERENMSKRPSRSRGKCPLARTLMSMGNVGVP